MERKTGGEVGEKRGDMQGEAGGNGEEKESFFARCCIIQEIKLPLPRFSEEKTREQEEKTGGTGRGRRWNQEETTGRLGGEDRGEWRQ